MHPTPMRCYLKFKTKFEFERMSLTGAAIPRATAFGSFLDSLRAAIDDLQLTANVHPATLLYLAGPRRGWSH